MCCSHWIPCKSTFFPSGHSFIHWVVEVVLPHDFRVSLFSVCASLSLFFSTHLYFLSLSLSLSSSSLSFLELFNFTFLDCTFQSFLVFLLRDHFSIFFGWVRSHYYFFDSPYLLNLLICSISWLKMRERERDKLHVKLDRYWDERREMPGMTELTHKRGKEVSKSLIDWRLTIAVGGKCYYSMLCESRDRHSLTLSLFSQAAKKKNETRMISHVVSGESYIPATDGLTGRVINRSTLSVTTTKRGERSDEGGRREGFMSVTSCLVSHHHLRLPPPSLPVTTSCLPCDCMQWIQWLLMVRK